VDEIYVILAVFILMAIVQKPTQAMVFKELPAVYFILFGNSTIEKAGNNTKMYSLA
jgi:hypothetical protein